MSLCGVAFPGHCIKSCVGYFPAVHADGIPHRGSFSFTGKGSFTCRNDIPDSNLVISILFLFFYELHSGYLDSVVAMHKCSYAFYVGLIGFVPTQDEGLSYLQSSGLDLVLVFHFHYISAAVFQFIGLVRIHFHESFVQLHYHLRACIKL
jgi:hypothetical protein